MPFPVFTSYAQADYEAHLKRFADDLREQIRSLLGRTDNESVMFFDRIGVKAGDKWNDVVIDAIRTADVLVCLVSPTYLGRPWCGRELQVFVQRNARRSASAQGRF